MSRRTPSQRSRWITCASSCSRPIERRELDRQGRDVGTRDGSAVSKNGGAQCGPIGRSEEQRLGQQIDGIATRSRPQPALEIAHTPYAQVGSLRQLFLRQSGCQTMAAKKGGEARRGSSIHALSASPIAPPGLWGGLGSRSAGLTLHGFQKESMAPGAIAWVNCVDCVWSPTIPHETLDSWTELTQKLLHT